MTPDYCTCALPFVPGAKRCPACQRALARFKVGDRVRIIANPFDLFNQDIEEMAGDVGTVADLEQFGTAFGYEVHFNEGEMRVEIHECDLQPEGEPYRERWDTALQTLSLIRTAITDPGAGYEIPAPEVAADAIDYAMAEIMRTVDPEALTRAGYEA